MRAIVAFFAVFFSFLLLFSGASAYFIDRHLIQADIADDGSAKVSEKFFLVFRNAVDLTNFRNKALENGPSIDAWSAFDGNIATHIDSIKGGTGRVLFEEKQSERFVSLEYETSEQFMKKKSETSRKILWEINQNVFRSFESASIYVIPNNTDISILLPKNALIEGDIVPTGVVSGNIVSWSGPINVSGKLVLDYSTEKQIAPGIGISKALQEIVANGTMPIIAIVIVIVLAIVYQQRKAISKKIEKYVVDHSQIESKPGREEEELE